MINKSDSKGTRILHVLDRSIPNLSGYSIRSKYIVEFQARMGLKPFAITTPNYDRETSHDLINGIEYHRSYVSPGLMEKFLYKLPFLREQAMMNRAEKKIEELIETNNIQIVHAHSPSLCGLPALKVARRRNLPMVYEVRAFWEDAAVDRKRFAENSLKYRISQMIEQKLFEQADTVVCICEGLRREVARRAPKQKIAVVQNGVDTSVFRPRDKSKALADKYKTQGKTVIGFIGSFFTFEGLADLVKSAAIVKQDRDDILVIIVGAGVEDHNLRRLVEELSLGGNTVVFAGRVPHEEVLDYYSIMDILVYPRISLRITELVTPLKPLEAMAMEKTVLVSDVRGLRELVIDGRNGVVFKAGDVHDLARKLTELVANPRRCLEIGRQAGKDMENERDWPIISKKYLEIYGSLLEVGPCLSFQSK